jgi:lactate permease
MAISKMVGRTLPFLSLVLPYYLVLLMAGFKQTWEVFPAILVSGLSFAFLQWFASNYLGPALPDVFAGLGSIIALVILLKFWKPKNLWRFKNEPQPSIDTRDNFSTAEILRAWSPFIVLTVMIIAWGMPPIKDLLNHLGQTQFEMPGLHNAIKDTKGNLLPHVYKFNYLSASGTAIFVSALISIPLVGLGAREGIKTFGETVVQLKYPIFTVAAVLGFAYLVNDSGITITMAEALASTGFLFPFFAPVLGWLGVFITGSDTSANALFGKLQQATANSIGVDPVVTVAANVSGGVVGKMISPQSIAVAAAAGGLIGKESDLFRFTVRHSFLMLLLICVIVLAQAYIFKWLIPSYQLLDYKAGTVSTGSGSGMLYLLVLLGILVAFASTIIIIGRRSARPKPN